ncbi:MAG: hypothetical protein HJJLKODD_01602 [Phycisphaerae bacterium]|nr:hypothetical protein [Phycisphaerae bacterium]
MAFAFRMLVVRESGAQCAALLNVTQRNEVQTSYSLSCQDALQRLTDYNPQVVLIDCPASVPPGGPAAFVRLLEAMDVQGIASVVLAGQQFQHFEDIPEWVQVLPYHLSSDELWGRLASIQHVQQIVRRAQLEMTHMQRLGKHLNQQFAEVDQEMRLASRLQKEFLPNTLSGVPGLAFAVLYRPASWVSGDIYDVSRVDEANVSFYVADAVGHGMAASLMTMFVKRAMVSKEISQGRYRVLSPSETLTQLNDAIVQQELKNSQFVTATYCVLNHKTRQLSFARGGHPYPILVEPDGSLRELRTEGGLLGLFPGQEFPDKTVQIKPGQKLIVHSDGMEQAFVEERDPETGEPRYRQEFRRVAHMPARQFITELEQIMDYEEGSLNPRDDITVLVVEVTE